MLGYDRLGDPGCVGAPNDAYRAWCTLKNYFTPVMKLVEKTRVGGRYRKRYDAPKTPAQRLLEWDGLPPAAGRELRRKMKTLNPFGLGREVERHLKKAFATVGSVPGGDLNRLGAVPVPEPSATAEDTSTTTAPRRRSSKRRKHTKKRTTPPPAPVS
mgnify:CR=1 FL=1